MREVDVRSLGVERRGAPRIYEWREDGPRDGQFLVRTRWSGISAGTELTFVKGTNPYLRAAWDDRLGVFRHDRPAAGYPVRTMGYMEVGEVVASRARGVAEGTRVAMAYGHRSARVADASADRWVVLPGMPGEMPPRWGVLAAHLGPICANALLHAAAEIRGRDVRGLGDGVRGRRVLVTGAGVVGLLTALLARDHGAAEVAVADRTPLRLQTAAALGLQPIDGAAAPIWEQVKQRWGGPRGDRGADVVFQCRGRASWLAEALRALRPQGTVIDLAFYEGGAADLRLGEEFHHNGLTIRAAQIARVPHVLAGEWSRERLQVETLAFLRARAALLERVLVTDVLPLEAGPQLLLDLAEHRRQALLAVLEL